MKFILCFMLLLNFPNFEPRDFRAYDRAAIKFRGIDADINYSVSDYADDMKQVEVGFV